jgi:hypothetical protein
MVTTEERAGKRNFSELITMNDPPEPKSTSTSLGFCSTHDTQETQLARETLRRLWTPVRVAKEMGEGLGRGKVLQRKMSEESR